MTEPYAAFAATGLALALIAAWAFAEAIVLPVVPDVGLGILLLAAPQQLPVLTAAAIGGGVVGALVLWGLLRHRPALVQRLLTAQPGLGEPGLKEARERLMRRGPLWGFVQLGPGLPLKAFTAALAEVAPRTGYAAVATYALTNRVTRLLPPAILFALAAPLLTGIEQSPVVFGALYVAAWVAFYFGYWWLRDPSRRRATPDSQ